MSRNRMYIAFLLSTISGFLFLVASSAAHAQSGRPVLIVQSVDEAKLVTIGGNTRPEANAKYDRGLVTDNFPLEHMMLQLKRSPEQEQELQQFIEDLTDSSSPTFHQWLSAKEFGEQYGLAQQDLTWYRRWNLRRMAQAFVAITSRKSQR
ncbi:MAG: protease pro-enzyme activation domain-containing protein [Terriglobales bacterium]